MSGVSTTGHASSTRIELASCSVRLFIPLESICGRYRVIKTLGRKCYKSMQMELSKIISDLLSFLDQQAFPIHLLRLIKTHGSQDCRRDITKNSISFCQTPLSRSIGQNERYLVCCMRSLWHTFFVQHLFGIAGRES